MRSPVRPALAVAGLCAAAAALVGCSSNDRAARPAPTPLPTTATAGKLLCGFVPRASVETALGRSDVTASGGVAKTSGTSAGGARFSRAACNVTVPHGGESPAFSVKVVPFTAGSGAGILRTAKLPNDFTYPSTAGVGFASYDEYTDGDGRSHRTCESGLVRGDSVITLGIEIPGKGRPVLDDTVALAQEIVAELNIPLRPSKPYPATS